MSDALDEQLGIILPVADRLFIGFLRALLKNDNFGSAILSEHFSGDLGGLDRGAAHLNAGIGRHQKHLLKVDLRALFDGERFHLDLGALFDSVLLTACFNNSVHRFSLFFKFEGLILAKIQRSKRISSK